MKQKLCALVLTILVTFLYGCGGTELQHGLTEEQANEVLVALQENHINAEKVLEPGEHPTWMIRVPTEQASTAWRIMKDHGLPKPLDKGLAETFGKDSLIPTATEEKALYLQATCNELQKTIEAMDGVVQARVHIVLPEEQIIPEENTADNPNHPKAAVLVKYRLNANGEVPYKEDSIKALVANSIPKLDPKDVVVVGNELSGSAPPPVNSAQPQADLVNVMGIRIARDSLNSFKAAGAGAFGLILILAIGLLFSARKSSSMKDELTRLRATRSDKLAKVG